MVAWTQFRVLSLQTAQYRSACFSLLTLILVAFPAGAQNLDTKEAFALIEQGKYEHCVSLCNQGIESNPWVEDWWLSKIRCQLAIGEYPQALETAEAALRRFSTSIRLRWIARDVYRFNGKTTEAGKMMGEINRLAEDAPWRYSDPVNRLCVGRFLLANGYDGRQVLELVYDRVKKEKPEFIDAYLASAELALSKNDAGLALTELNKVLRYKPDSVDYYFLLARANAESDREKTMEALQTVLKKNPRHVPSMLMLADHMVDGERYSDAKRILIEALATNLRHPLVWSYLAVISHLEGDFESEGEFRTAALSWFKLNPEVDHLIGRKLSQKYRFAEGRRYQERALKMDGDFVAAKIQLSQDLLRLGEEKAGWELAHQVYDVDGYNVVAHNLVTLESNIAKFRTLETEGFLVRMSAREASIYGDRVLELLSEARKVLCEKYDVKLKEPTIVEIFPEQKDFAIRTFGLPGGSGFLGVCFGRVITANSPAALQDTPSNWESVLWHEFCHVVTLQKTENKMPRWLSEGISVYEERLRDRTWGQRMNPEYRKRILSGSMTPVSRLSDAFLTPSTAMDLQFAYYQSSLVVEYLIEEHGIDVMKRILRDLSVGMPMNEALSRYVGDLDELNKQFTAFAEAQAKQLAPNANWSAPELDPRATLFEVQSYNIKNKNVIEGLRREAVLQMKEENWDEAEKPLRQIIKLYPDDHISGNAYELLAMALRSQEKTSEERKVLEQLAANSCDATACYMRLVDLASKGKEWPAVVKFADMQMAVNPLVGRVHEAMAAAARETKQPKKAIRSLRSLIHLEPVDPAKTHFQLGELLWQQKESDEAKRQVLKALEQAPRYQAAQELLLSMIAEQAKKKSKESDATSAERSLDPKSTSKTKN